jgi:hypothetical protein
MRPPQSIGRNRPVSKALEWRPGKMPTGAEACRPGICGVYGRDFLLAGQEESGFFALARIFF